jgi:dTMP kinase
VPCWVNAEMAHARGKLIVICGIDGTGKTTLEQNLADYLRRRGRKVHVTKQPTDFYRSHPEVRQFLNTGERSVGIDTIALIAAMDRMLHIERDIAPRLSAGEWVICNRYVYSSYAYFKCRGADYEFVRAINAKVRKPDFGILLTLPAEIASKRILLRDGNTRKFEEKDPAYLARVQHMLLSVFPKDFVRIDSRLSVADVVSQSIKYIDETSCLENV